MRRNLILAGVGGQGLLSIAAVLGEAARSEGLHLKQAEVHGMAQRGGVVQSHVRLADEPIHSDLIREGTADLILALEPMEALRYLPFLSASGAVVSNRKPIENTPSYPEIERVLAEVRSLPTGHLIDADGLAKEAGSARCVNMVMLGAGSAFYGLSEEALKDGIRAVFAGKSEAVVAANLRGFDLGRDTTAGSRRL